MKHRSFALAFVLLVLVVVGFGSFAHYGVAPRPTVVARSVDAALAAMPAEATFVGAVDLPRLGASSEGARLLQRMTGELVEACRFATERPGVLVFGGDMGFAAGTWAALLDGQMGESAVERCLETALAPSGSAPVKETVAGRTAYHADERAAEDAWLALAADGRLALAGQRAWLEHTLDPAAPRARQRQILAAQAGFVDQNAAIWAVGLLTDEQRKQLEQLADGKLESAPSTIRVTGYFSDQVTIEVAGAFENPRLALQAVALVKGAVLVWQQSGKDQPWLALLDDMKVTVQGSDAIVRVKLDAKDVDYLADALARGVSAGRLPAW